MPIVGEQTTICRYKIDGENTDLEIQMTVQLERRPEPYADVEIWRAVGDVFPEEIGDALYQRMNNGVHGGYGRAHVPYIPDTELYVKIVDLKVTPMPQTIQDVTERCNLGYLLEMTMSGIVQTLLRSIENIRTGKETYKSLDALSYRQSKRPSAYGKASPPKNPNTL
jgi:hypothetical protein